MPKQIEDLELENQREDYVAYAAKASLGAIPFVGSLLVEIAGVVIPNQRIDRITKFARALEKRLSDVENKFVESQLDDEYFTDLVEEGLRQASRSLSDERREYIAALIANSLTSEDIEYQESKHLLRILNEINDIEVIWLRSFLVEIIGRDKKFRKKHEEVLQPIRTTLGSPQEEMDKAALQDSYKQHLAQLGLLEPKYKTDNKTKQPVRDRRTGATKIRGYKITRLGRLLLREVGLQVEDSV